MKASRLVLFFVCIVSIPLINNRNLSAAHGERMLLSANKGQASKNWRSDLTRANVAQLPLFFEANQGQTNPRVRFLSRSSGYTLFLTPTETVLVEERTQVASSRWGSAKVSSDSQSSLRSVLRMRLVDANPSPKVIGMEELPGKVNYLIGNDPRKWHTGISLYSQVRSEQVYRGIDLVFHGDDRRLEYDFVVSPAADPNRVVFQITGAKAMDLNQAGDLVLHTADSEIVMHKPAIYQAIAGQQRPVEGAFVLRAKQEVGFQIGSYDRSQALVIDPTITYATFLGGAGQDKGTDAVLDTSTPAAPKLYVPGQTTDISTFPETSNPLLGVSGGKHYAFLAKIDPTLTGAASLDYLTFIGGSKTLAGTLGCKTNHGHMALDTSQGAANVEPVLVGETTCEDFPVTTGSMTSGGDDDFVTRLHSTGGSLDTSIFFGGNGFVAGPWVSLDTSGNVLLTDGTTSTNLPTTAGAYMTKFNNGATGTFEDCFVAKLSRSGLVPTYVTYLNVGAGSTSTNTFGCGAIIGSSGLIGAGGGTFSSTAFAPAGGANGFQPTFHGMEDTFLMVLNPSLNGTSQLVYATYIGGGGLTIPGYGALSLSSGVVAIVGGTTSSGAVRPPDIPLKNAYQSTNLGASSAGQATGFATVVDTTKTGAASLISSTYFGGSSGNDFIQSVGLDPLAGSSSYRVLLGGQTSSANFPTKNPLQSSLVGTQNGFISMLLVPSSTVATTPAALLFSTYIGGGVFLSGSGENETIQGVVTDLNHTVYARGRTLSSSFFGHTTPAIVVNGFQTTCASCAATMSDVVVFKIPNPAQTESSTTTLTSSLNPSTAGQSVTFTATVAAGSADVPGTPTGTVTFKDGTTALSTGALTGGIAKFTTSTLTAGKHSITAAYGGDATFLASTSAVLSQVVNGSGGGGAVTFTPASLSFPQQLVGAKSASLPVTLKNSGTGALTITSIVAVGNFSETNNCPLSPATLAPAATCTINVSFTPSITGKVLGEITVTDNAPGTTQEIGLSGNGVTALNFSPMSLSFGTVPVGTTTAAKIVTVINNSTTLLTLSFGTSGNYAIPASGTTCAASLAAKVKCNIAVTFTPHYNGVINGTMTLSYNAAFSPVEVALSGSGTGATAPLSFTPASLSFAGQLTGTPSASQVVTVTNHSVSSITINSISASGDYSAVASGATPCGNRLALASTHTCTFSVTFKPSVSGTIPGAVWIADSSAQSPQVMTVTGKGVVSVSLSPSSLNFGTVSKNTVSAAKTITVTNNNHSTAVTLNGFAVSGDYKVMANNCPLSLAAKSSCSFSVSFAPTAAGVINGVASVSYASSGSPQVVGLTGTGQ
jgi:Bacterial Ig-like domain (group 3)/Abnormal spindle-like microcephaly-assoc'd, ASPM-SPD-2-Hydin